MKKSNIIIALIILTLIITISIIYNTLPRLQLNGSKNMIISYRQEYEEPGVIVKNANSKYMSRIKIDSNINTKTIGNYYIDYSLKIGGKNLHVRRNVKVIDDIAPVIKLNGNQITELSINKEYEEPGYTAQDEYDGNLTDKVEIIRNIDIENYGEYIITYKVIDNSGNTTEVNRIVKIIDEEPPKIICKTDYSTFKINSENIIGCTAQDNYDGNLTDKIEISGKYDKYTPGIYSITYKVKDDAGNKTEKNHNMIIYDNLKNTPQKIIINIKNSEQLEKILSIINKLDDKPTIPTIYICLEENKKTEESINQIEHLLEENIKIGLTNCEKEISTYNNINTFQNKFETITEKLQEKYDIKINKYKNSEEKNISDEKTTKQIKEYLEQNKIEYIINQDTDMINVDKGKETETIEKLIQEILTNNNKKNIEYYINNDETSLALIQEILKILKDINNNIEIEINIK